MSGERERLNAAVAAMEGRIITPARGGKRQMSDEARERIREAQRRRWEAVRKSKESLTATATSKDNANTVTRAQKVLAAQPKVQKVEKVAAK